MFHHKKIYLALWAVVMIVTMAVVFVPASEVFAAATEIGGPGGGGGKVAVVVMAPAREIHRLP